MVCVMCFGLEYGTLISLWWGFELTLVWLVIVSSILGGGERSAF